MQINLQSLVILTTLILSSFILKAQTNFNMTQLSNLQYPEGCNDIWGYVDENGIEYAILGTRAATAIISLEDPANPVEVANIPGSNSTWRDIKTWGHYAYVTCDAGNDGLLIINLENLPESITYEFWKPELEVNGSQGTLLRCHNIFIDENGYAYISGCNPLNGGGVIIFDVFSVPGKPTLVGHVEFVYSHDNFVRGDTVYSANLTEGFYITDVSVKNDPITLATKSTSLFFTHNVWMSDDGDYLFTTDERANAYLDAYDISDLSDIKLVDRWQPIDTRGTGVIPHNTHYIDGYNVVSWYTDGVKVLDSHRPSNLVEVANFDTYLGGQTGFQGCWGAYPYLPSGLLLASDINTCLWVFDVDYVRAAYLEGIVVNALTQEPIQGADVVIQGVQPNEGISTPDGRFKTGSNQGGTLTVRANKTGFQSKEVTFEFVPGQITDVTIELFPLEVTTISGTVITEEDGLPIENASVYFQSLGDPALVFTSETDEDGNYSINDIFVGEYEVIAGAWGYAYKSVNPLVVNNSTENIALAVGYYDDFIFDYGWMESGSAPVGNWARGEPEAIFFGNDPTNPGEDLQNDFGDACFVTGLQAGQGAGSFDLDDGTSLLLSPEMDLTDYENPILRYHYWYVNTGGASTPDDTLLVYIINNGEEIPVKIYPNSTFAWVEDSIVVSDILDEWGVLQIRFDAADLPGSGHIVEAGVDGFWVEDAASGPSSIDLISTSGWSTMPNPFSTTCLISFDEAVLVSGSYKVVDLHGRVVETGQLENQSNLSLGQLWTPGVYFLQVFQAGRASEVQRLVKLD